MISLLWMLGSLCDLSSLDARLSLWHGLVRMLGSVESWVLGLLGFLRMPWFGTYLSLVDGCVWDPFGLSLVPSHDLSLFWLIGSRVSCEAGHGHSST